MEFHDSARLATASGNKTKLRKHITQPVSRETVCVSPFKATWGDKDGGEKRRDQVCAWARQAGQMDNAD